MSASRCGGHECSVQRAMCVYNYAYNSTTRCHLLAVPPHTVVCCYTAGASVVAARTTHVAWCRHIGIATHAEQIAEVTLATRQVSWEMRSTHGEW